MKKIIISTFSLALILTMANSCKKPVAYEDLPEVSTDVDTTLRNAEEVNAQFQQLFTAVHTEVSNVEDQAFKTGGSYPSNPNAVVTTEIDSTDKKNKFAKKVTIDFPFAYKDTKYKGHTFYGTIVVTKNGRMDKKGTIATISVLDLLLDNKFIGGTLALENLGFVNGVYKLKLDLTNNGIYSYVNNVQIHHTMDVSVDNKVYRVALSGTQSFSYVISGSVTTEITSPLIYTTDCNYIKQGAKKVTTSSWLSDQATTTDYGDGTCDDKSTVIVGPETYKWPIHLIEAI
ncbi:MAG: hypothetical protein ACKOXB_04375 [Flavobacteriales bacterium]